AHGDPDGGRTPVEPLRGATQRMEAVFVVLVRLRGEVVPHEALYRMVPGADARVPIGLRDYGTKHLEPRHLPRRLPGFRPPHREAEELALRGRGRRDGEGDGIRSGDRERLEPVDDRRLETHLPSSVPPAPMSAVRFLHLFFCFCGLFCGTDRIALDGRRVPATCAPSS